LAATGDLAIDLGTANTLVFVRGRGIVVDEPSVVAVDLDGQVHAVGQEAERMLGRTPATISASRPLRDGVIADFEVTEQMLRHFIRRGIGSGRGRPRLIVCAPTGIRDVESRAVVEAAFGAGARDVALIEEPIAAAIGADLRIGEPVGRMVVDVGGGTSEVAVLSLGGMVVSASMRLGGHAMDEAIVSHLKHEHRMAIGSRSAEQLKIAAGAAHPGQPKLQGHVRGRDLESGLPRQVDLDTDEVRAAIDPVVAQIVEGIRDTLDRTPPELAADIGQDGILLAGGGSLLRGFADRVSDETRMPARIADKPLHCVVLGAGRALEELDRFTTRGRRRRYQVREEPSNLETYGRSFLRTTRLHRGLQPGPRR
jgi:rod shape-determining protein MreB